MIEIRRVLPGHPLAASALRDYITDIVSRYHGRDVTPEEVDEVERTHTSESLAPPAGAFLLALDAADGTVLGCVGVRTIDPGVTELKRMFVYPHARRRGVATSLLLAAEAAARELGATTMRLDTRKDLVEARAMYPKHGYAEIARYNDEEYADHWFEKAL